MNHNNLNIQLDCNTQSQQYQKVQRFNCPNITRESPTEQPNSSNMMASIKRPNSTIGIPSSVFDPSYFTTNEFKPTTREKATSLTLDPKSYQNSLSNTPSGKCLSFTLFVFPLRNCRQTNHAFHVT